MNSEGAYEIWAPSDGPWSPWVKPVLFASEPSWDGANDPDLPVVGEPTWLPEPERTGAGYREVDKKRTSTDVATAFVLDVPGPHGVAWAMALAKKGWRPIPLYNAIPGGVAAPPPPPSPPPGTDPFGTAPPPFVYTPLDLSALIDMGAILVAMRRATSMLVDLKLAVDRPPVFVLDADRRLGHGIVSPGRFDNRSISLPTDFPSALFLRSRGIERVVLIQNAGMDPQEDLSHTLLAWQQGGVNILAKSLADEAPPAAIEVIRPSTFRSMTYRLFAAMGLKRSPLGGFGGTIPLPSSG